MESRPLKTIIVGGGHRSLTYAQLANIEKDKMEIVGVADPDETRRNAIAKQFNIPAERCFKTSDEITAVPKFADAVINGTMTIFTFQPPFPFSKQDMMYFLKNRFL